MEKFKRFFISGAVILTIVLMTLHGVAFPEEGGTECRGADPVIGNCSTVNVKVRPAYFPQSPADHTYVKFAEEDGQWESFPCFGACTGGNLLTDTESFVFKDNKKIVKYMATEKPCRWPSHYYLIIGVCHQLANRSLFHTGKTVKNARMYNWSSFFYYTYGACFWPLKKYCFDNCQEASEALGPWKPGVPPGCNQSESEKRSLIKPDDECMLYVKHFGNLKGAKDSRSMKDVFKNYRDELFSLYYQQRVGDQKKADFLPILIKGHDVLIERKEELDYRLLKQGKPDEKIFDEYNELFKDTLLQLSRQVPTDVYKRFFGMQEDQVIDVRWFKPSDEG